MHIYFISQIFAAEVDFFVRDTDAIKEELLKTKEENGIYPPRFRVVIGCFPPTSPLPAKFQFTGSRKELVFDAILRPQLSSSPSHSPGNLPVQSYYTLLCWE